MKALQISLEIDTFSRFNFKLTSFIYLYLNFDKFHKICNSECSEESSLPAGRQGQAQHDTQPFLAV